MWWIIGIIVIITIVRGLAEPKDLATKIMLFSGFLLILGLTTSKFFGFMGTIAEISALVLIGSTVVKAFQKIFID